MSVRSLALSESESRHSPCTEETRGVFRGPCVWAQPTLIFDDGIFCHFTNFSSRMSKFRHILTKKLQLLESNPDPYRGFAPRQTGGLPSPDPLGTHFSHILLRHWEVL